MGDRKPLVVLVIVATTNYVTTHSVGISLQCTPKVKSRDIARLFDEIKITVFGDHSLAKKTSASSLLTIFWWCEHQKIVGLVSV